MLSSGEEFLLLETKKLRKRSKKEGGISKGGGSAEGAKAAYCEVLACGHSEQALAPSHFSFPAAAASQVAAAGSQLAICLPFYLLCKLWSASWDVS